VNKDTTGRSNLLRRIGNESKDMSITLHAANPLTLKTPESYGLGFNDPFSKHEKSGSNIFLPC